MKKIFTYSLASLLVVFLFTSCAKERYHDDGNPWLSEESGSVVYSNNSCGLYVVETAYGYTVIQNIDGLRIDEDDIVYGNFGGYGTRNFFNYTANLVITGKVVEYDLTYNEAQHEVDYYCPLGLAGGFKMKQSATSQSKIPRTLTPVK